VGDTIVKEFPNSRMATEVRDKMELLKQRASEMEAVG
jgi:outer membrane protein assembly factor BamD (BamD/ComL family)